MRSYVFVLGLCCLPAACTPSGSDSKKTATLASLSLDDFRKLKAEATPIEDADLATSVENVDLENKYQRETDSETSEPAETAEGEEDDSCLGKAMDAGSFGANGHVLSLEVAYTPDPACVAAEKAQALEALDQVGFSTFLDYQQFSFVFKSECTNDVTGHTREEIEADLEAICGAETGMSTFVAGAATISLFTKVEGQTKETATQLTMQSFFVGSNGDICKSTTSDQTVTEADTCLQGTYSQTKTAEATVTKYAYGTRQKLVATVNASWYDSGTVALELNDWQGTVTYPSKGANPTYSMTKGATTRTGTISPFVTLTGSQLKQLKLPKKLLRLWQKSEH